MKSYNIRASVYKRKRMYQEAINDYSNSIQFDSTFSFHFTQYVLLDRANLYSTMKKYNLAERDYKIYLLKYPDNFVPQDYYLVKIMQNDVPGLINLYTWDINLNPTNGYAYYSRAVYKEQIGDEKGACDDYKKAKSLGVKR
ncbi:MAG: hypothetical protein PF481_09590 [Bacteroidales bacterium]|jgi:tetratricopeptide (TPR) repeat protein|nr:hypothetical protein [Bacteroidales bacterium]